MKRTMTKQQIINGIKADMKMTRWALRYGQRLVAVNEANLAKQRKALAKYVA